MSIKLNYLKKFISKPTGNMVLFSDEKFKTNELKKYLSNSEFSFMRGAFLSIDRPYGKVLNFLHHNIGTSHVVHHVCPTIPHYHAKKATALIKRSFKKAYLYNPDPIHLALWNVACNCIAVKSELNKGRYVWQSSFSKD